MKPSADSQAPFTLGLGISLLRPGHMWGLMAIVLGVPLAVLAGLIVGADCLAGDWGRAHAALGAAWDELLREPANRLQLWALAVLLPLLFVYLLGQRTAVIRVLPTGLQASIPRWLGLGLFNQTAGHWHILWEDLQHVRLVAPRPTANRAQLLGAQRLELVTARGTSRVNPFAWFRRGGPEHRLGLGELLRLRRLDPQRLVQRAPLLRVLEARGLAIERVDPPVGPAVAGGFDLARHRGMRIQLVLLFAAGLYALCDSFLFAAFRPLELPPLWPFVGAAGAAAAVATALGRGAPRTERIGVGLMTVIALVAAVYPATLRVNAATAEPRVVPYLAIDHGRFLAVGRTDLPPIDLADAGIPEYWSRFPPGSEHDFTLLRGSAGFYQLDLGPLYERTRRFYSPR